MRSTESYLKNSNEISEKEDSYSAPSHPKAQARKEIPSDALEMIQLAARADIAKHLFEEAQ